MSNSYFISMTPAIAAVQTVVDANAVILVDIHDTDLPVVDTVVDAIRATDVVNILGGQLTDKEKAFVGSERYPVLKDDFSEVGNGAAPDATLWNVTTDNDGTLVTTYDPNGQRCVLEAGTVNNNDTYMDTNTFRNFDLEQLVFDNKELHFKTRIFFNDITGMFGLGFLVFNIPASVDNFNVANRHMAVIYGNNDVIASNTTDGAVQETNNLSAYFSDGVAVVVEIIVGAASVEFWIDGTLRATHSTRIPLHSMVATLSARNQNGIQSIARADYALAWVN